MTHLICIPIFFCSVMISFTVKAIVSKVNFWNINSIMRSEEKCTHRHIHTHTPTHIYILTHKHTQLHTNTHTHACIGHWPSDPIPWHTADSSTVTQMLNCLVNPCGCLVGCSRLESLTVWQTNCQSVWWYGWPTAVAQTVWLTAWQSIRQLVWLVSSNELLYFSWLVIWLEWSAVNLVDGQQQQRAPWCKYPFQ